ncbi:MAG: hypothetical protein IPO47_19320 [Bacteroidetes bacterium]|nr:hypothetical protein [Bacteroidota bacterium]
MTGKTYLTYHMVDGASPYLSSNFVKENFEFHSKKLNGIEQIKPRWKRVVETADFCLGEALGKNISKPPLALKVKQYARNWLTILKLPLENVLKL